jgi:hypothetical protein
MDVDLLLIKYSILQQKLTLPGLHFFFCPSGWRWMTNNPDGGRLLGSAALCLSLQVCNSVLTCRFATALVSHCYKVASRRRGKKLQGNSALNCCFCARIRFFFLRGALELDTGSNVEHRKMFLFSGQTGNWAGFIKPTCIGCFFRPIRCLSKFLSKKKKDVCPSRFELQTYRVVLNGVLGHMKKDY